MKDLDIIIYEALSGDPDLMQAVGGRIKSTSFEVSPDEQDNTPLPYIIVTDDGMQAAAGTKDNTWESDEDEVQSSIEIGAKSPKEVKVLMKMCRRAVSRYIAVMTDDGEDVPSLTDGFPKSDGVMWDWMKPCYYTHLIYQCIISNDL